MQKNKREKKVNKIIERMTKDQRFRRELVRESHFYFFQTFFRPKLEYPCSWFHKEMFAMSEDRSNKMIAIMAFRGSGKSTIMNFSYSLWAILGKLQKKFVLIIGKTNKQTKLQFENIKNEMNYNLQLKKDLGLFQEERDEWGTNLLELKKFNARIMMVSIKQSIRGLINGPHRPDLIICDDIEDSLSVESEKEKNKLHQWFTSEVLTVGDKNTKIVMLGNLLTEDSLLLRIRNEIEKGNIQGIFRAYPLLDDNNRIVWPEKFRTPEDILNFRKTILDEEVWNREYLLKMNDINIVLKLCKTREDVEKEWFKEENVFRIKEAPLNPKNYRISAPIFEKSIIRIISRNPDGSIKEENL